MIDTQKIRKERWTSSEMIRKLCNKVDQLQEAFDILHTGYVQLIAQRDSFCSGNDEKINEIQQLSRELFARNSEVIELNIAARNLRGHIDVRDKQITNLKEQIVQLRKAPQPPTRVGEVINKQEKEITELKGSLHTARKVILGNDKVKAEQRGEIIKLKAELNAINGACTHLVPRQKLTEAIRDVLDREFYRSHATVTLQEALRKYGTK